MLFRENVRPNFSSERAPHIDKTAVAWQYQKSDLEPQIGLGTEIVWPTDRGS
jgi:hypothetical protein